MQYRAVARGEGWERRVAGCVLVHDVRDDQGGVRVDKGRVLAEADVERLGVLPWTELHVATLDVGDVHEDEAGTALACAAAGEGVRVGSRSAGHWPLVAERRGIVEIAVESLTKVNAHEGLAVYTLFHGHVVDDGEVVGRAKITPFAVPRPALDAATETARAARGLIRVRGFRHARLGAVVLESLAQRNPAAIGRFGVSLGEKTRWFGAELVAPIAVEPNREAVATALRRLIRDGCDVIVVAGTRAMDELDPSFLALADIGAERVRQGVPAHPGSLLWIAHADRVPVLGLPSCGLFSEATVFDLVLPRMLTGEEIGAPELAALGHGGFLTREIAYRFPPYRPSRRRGEVVD